VPATVGPPEEGREGGMVKGGSGCAKAVKL